LFSQNITAGTNNSAFDGEVKALEVALNNLSFHLKMFTKAAILVASKAAIQAITSNQTPEDETIIECSKLLKHVQKQNKSIVFQWIPSNIGIVGNGIADELAKKGTRVQTSLHSRPNLRRKVDEVKKVFQNEHSQENFEATKGKTWEKIDELAAEVKSKGRKEAAAKFRLMSGHDCLTHHLHKTGIY
jgi:ribonuclease HI